MQEEKPRTEKKVRAKPRDLAGEVRRLQKEVRKLSSLFQQSFLLRERASKAVILIKEIETLLITGNFFALGYGTELTTQGAHAVSSLKTLGFEMPMHMKRDAMTNLIGNLQGLIRHLSEI